MRTVQVIVVCILLHISASALAGMHAYRVIAEIERNGEITRVDYIARMDSYFEIRNVRNIRWSDIERGLVAEMIAHAVMSDAGVDWNLEERKSGSEGRDMKEYTFSLKRNDGENYVIDGEGAILCLKSEGIVAAGYGTFVRRSAEDEWLSLEGRMNTTQQIKMAWSVVP